MNKRVPQTMLPRDLSSCGSLSFRLNFVHRFTRLGLPTASVVVTCLVSLTFVAASPAQQASASKHPATFAQLSAQADAARDADRLDEAINLYRRALALRPSWAEGWWSLGTIYYDRDAYDKAAFAFQKLVALQPQNGTAQAMLGLCEFGLVARPRVASPQP